MNTIDVGDWVRGHNQAFQGQVLAKTYKGDLIIELTPSHEAYTVPVSSCVKIKRPTEGAGPVPVPINRKQQAKQGVLPE